MRKITLIALLVAAWSITFGQTRYIDQVFDGVTLTDSEIYGANTTIITLLDTSIARPIKIPLFTDIYEPTGDTLDSRPLVILLKTGNFLPQVLNGSIYGTRKDSALVEVANRLAKMGYVVASTDYREGWNPFQETQPARALQLIQAAYRGIQDVRSAVKYFKLTAAAGGNPHRIDPDKIVLWGMGTGGYMSLGATYLDQFIEIITTTNPPGKFLTDLTGDGNPDPMVIPSINGDLEVDSFGIVPPGGLLIFAAGDTLSFPNHQGIPYSVNLCVNMGGALGDISWMDANEAPLISFHVPLDNNAPYNDDVLRVPTTGDAIVQVQGSFAAVTKANELGLNDVFAGIDDPMTDAAKAASAAAGHEYVEGLYPLNIVPHDTAGSVDGSPWNWWDSNFWSQIQPSQCPTGAPVAMCNWNLVSLQGAPFTSAARGRTYIDTIMGYFAPRAVAALGLDQTSSVTPLEEAQVGLFLAPNPIIDQFRIRTNQTAPIRSASLYNMEGKELGRWNKINQNELRVERFSLPSGTYLMRLQFDEGIITKKLIFK